MRERKEILSHAKLRQAIQEALPCRRHISPPLASRHSNVFPSLSRVARDTAKRSQCVVSLFYSAGRKKGFKMGFFFFFSPLLGYEVTPTSLPRFPLSLLAAADGMIYRTQEFSILPAINLRIPTHRLLSSTLDSLTPSGRTGERDRCENNPFFILTGKLSMLVD